MTHKIHNAPLGVSKSYCYGSRPYDNVTTNTMNINLSKHTGTFGVNTDDYRQLRDPESKRLFTDDSESFKLGKYGYITMSHPENFDALTAFCAIGEQASNITHAHSKRVGELSSKMNKWIDAYYDDSISLIHQDANSIDPIKYAEVLGKDYSDKKELKLLLNIIKQSDFVPQ